MSIKCVNRVWEHSKVGGTQLLVLLAIADHAHDDGSGAYPSYRTLARKCKLSRRHVPRVISKLEENGELVTERGAGPNGTHVYTVLSGLINDNATRCFMCDEIDDGSVEFDEHHRIPGDDQSIVPLCRPCHLKLHHLTRGGDKLSPVNNVMPSMTSDEQSDDLIESPEPSLTVNEPSTPSPEGDKPPSLFEGKANTRDETSLPETWVQTAVLFGGRTDTNGNEAIADAESRLMRSGWNVRGKKVKDRLVYLLAATGWDVPTTDNERKDWYKTLRDDHAKYHVSEVFELYKQAHEKLSRRVLETDGDFAFPARPGALTKTMESILEAQRIKANYLPDNVRINPDGTKTLVVTENSTEDLPPNVRLNPDGTKTLIVT